MNTLIYIFTLITLAILDCIWLLSMGSSYRSWLGHLFASNFNFTPAIIFYLIYAFGLGYFVISPALQNHTSLTHTFFIGALLGLLAYAAYDLTNQATLKDWPIMVTIIDMAWGALLSGITSAVVVCIYTTFFK